MTVKRLKFQGKELPYQEGTVFALPFREDGYTLGVVARVSSSLGILVYLYDTVFQKLPTKSTALQLKPKDAVLKLRASGLYLVDGRWKILGEIDNFIREEWFIPKYIHREIDTGRAWLVQYDDDDYQERGNEVRVPFDTTTYLPQSLYGAGAVEIEVEETITIGLEFTRPLPYQEGFVFAMPLLTGGYALGVVARTTKVGEIVFVYIFGKRFSFLPSKEDWVKLDPQEAVFKPRIYDISLKNRRWPILGKLENWKREEWPMPKYIIKYFIYPLLSKDVRIEAYKDSCPAEKVTSEKVPIDYIEEGLEIAEDGPYGVPQIEKIVADFFSSQEIQEVSTKTKRKKKLPYQQGSIFAVPLQDGGYCLGVVARASGQWNLLGYFYDKRYATVPTQKEFPQFDPQKAFLKLRMSDEDLLRGVWPVLGIVEGWKKEEWPVPYYIRRNTFKGQSFTETFFDKELGRIGGGDCVPFESTGYLPSVIYTAEAAAYEITQAFLYGVERPLPYQEGTVFATPIKTGGYILGVVARTTKVGEIVVAYLFKEKFSSLPEKKAWPQFDPKNAFARPRVLDSYLQNKRWPILGTLPDFKRDEWPMPKYLAREKGFADAWLETYKDSCPAERLLSKKVPFDFPLGENEEGSLFGPYIPYQVEDRIS